VGDQRIDVQVCW